MTGFTCVRYLYLLFFFFSHAERRVKADPRAEFKVALEINSVSWFPSAP